MCREYDADPLGMYKFRAVGVWLTNGEWWQPVDGDYTKFIMTTSQGLTSEGFDQT